MKSVFTPLAKCVLLPFALTAAMSATDTVIEKNIYGEGTTALIILNEEKEDIMKIVKSLEKSGLLIKGISGTVENKAKTKNKKVDFFQCY